MSHASPQDLDSRKRLLQQIVTLDDLTEQRIFTLRALTYSNIHLPWLNVRVTPHKSTCKPNINLQND
jgi:hypothetical protein